MGSLRAALLLLRQCIQIAPHNGVALKVAADTAAGHTPGKVALKAAADTAAGYTPAKHQDSCGVLYVVDQSHGA